MFTTSHTGTSHTEELHTAQSPARDSAHALLNAAKFEIYSPLDAAIPLRQRDEQVLTELFRLEEIEAIEEDIACNLLCRCPEPCWEDDPFEFLKEYL